MTMQRRFFIALLTVVVFGAGYFARVWTEGQVPLPPPLEPGGEFVPAPQSAAAKSPASHHKLPTRKQLAAEIECLKPQIDMFRRRLHGIDVEFDHNLRAILTPEQRERFAERERRRHNDPRELHSQGPLLTDRQIMMLHEQPLYAALDHISLSLKLTELNKDLNFTPAQRHQVRDLLLRRRDEFLALVDSVPPPSLILSRLAAVAQRIEAPSGSDQRR